MVWIDLEMTGLDPREHVIVEAAVLVTDEHLEIVAEGPDLVIFQPPSELAKMEPVVVEMHARSGLTPQISASTVSVAEAEQAIVSFIAEHTVPKTAPLCGNSIWKDKQFLEAYMPKVTEALHYRLVDVSTIKELARRWYPAVKAPRKGERHRALDDIKESLEELKFYRAHVFAKE